MLITPPKTRWIYLLLLIAQATFVSNAFSQSQKGASEELDEIHQWIIEEHPSVSHINGLSLEPEIKATDDLVVFDVREEEEFDVSHLNNAIRVDPKISASDFTALFGDQLKDKKVVFYCSVGRRSSALAEKIAGDALEFGALEVLNLENGIFGWHNQHRPLMSEHVPTKFVHPYNRKWGEFIQQKELIRYEVD